MIHPPIGVFLPKLEVDVLLSMTGYGESRYADERLSIAIELRSVNNRHFKLSAKISEAFAALEPEVERQIKETVHRGTVQVSVRIERPRRPEDYRLNLVALASYRDQIAQLGDRDGQSLDVASLLVLPGVVETRKEQAEEPRDGWPAISRVLGEALEKFHATRLEEGRVMGEELKSQARTLSATLDRLESRSPIVVTQYQTRLRERVQALVADHGLQVETNDLIREVAILAERADVSEEITRLRAHLTQFVDVLSEEESGRKLEFIVQEMGRETNTIGSKANDIEVSRLVFEMKGSLEKIRELIQNVE